jgi:hypothetical protein
MPLVMIVSPSLGELGQALAGVWCRPSGPFFLSSTIVRLWGYASRSGAGTWCCVRCELVVSPQPAPRESARRPQDVRKRSRLAN